MCASKDQLFDLMLSAGQIQLLVKYCCAAQWEGNSSTRHPGPPG